MTGNTLSEKKKKLVLTGCTFLILALAMISESLSVIQTPMLEQLSAKEYFSLVAIVGSIGTAIFTPVGGKLGDLFGRRNVILFAGTIAIIANAVVALSSSIVPYFLGRFVIGSAMGAYISTPYVLANSLSKKENVPRMMGILAAAMSLGGLMGAYIAGMMWRAGLKFLSVIFPSVFILIGVLLVSTNLPNEKSSGNAKLDKLGMLILAICLSCLLVGINMTTRNGITLISAVLLLIGIVTVFLLIQVEKKAEQPLIPLSLFKNKLYSYMLIVGFIGYFYVSSMRVYGPLAVTSVLGLGTDSAGQLQIPRTIITIILSTFAGAWVGKKTSNRWKAMVIATLLVALPFIGLSFVSPTSSILLFLVGFGITGIAESFRSVSITPVAQSALDPKDIGIGTALVNFINTLAYPLASSIFGIAYDISTKADPTNVALVNVGIRNVFLTSAIVSAIGFVFVITKVRPLIDKNA